MKSKLTFLLALTFLFLFSGSSVMFAGLSEELSELNPLQLTASNHMKHFQQCGFEDKDIDIATNSYKNNIQVIVYFIKGHSIDLECLITNTKSDAPPKIAKLAKAADKGEPIIYPSLFNIIELGDGGPRPELEGLIKLNSAVLVFIAPWSDSGGIEAINKFSSKYIIVAIGMSTHTRNYLVSIDSKEIRHLTDGFKVEVVDKEKLIFKVIGRKSYFKNVGGAFWYNAIIDRTGKIIGIDNDVDVRSDHKVCFSKEEFLKKSFFKLPDSVQNEICVER